MAQGKTFKVTAYADGVAAVRATIREDYDLEENYSTLTVTALQGYVSHRIGWAYINAKITAGGVTVLPATNGSWMVSCDATSTFRNVCKSTDYAVLWKSVTSEPIYHDADGTKTVTVKLTLSDMWMDNYNATNNSTASLSIALTPIPRASGVTASDGEIGSDITVSVTKASDAFTHTLRYTFGEVSGVIVENSGETTVSWTPPMELCRQIPDDPSGVCTITCDTYNGTELVGTKTTPIKLTVPASVGLTASEGWAAVVPYNDGTAADGLSVYVQGYSKAAVIFDPTKISADDAYGASIKSYRIACNGKYYTEPYRTDVLSEGTAVTVTATVIDTRGIAVNEDFTITVEPYAKPIISDVNIFRSNSLGVEADTGTYLSVFAEAAISSVAGLNAPTMLLSIGKLMTVEIPNGRTVVVGDGLVLATATHSLTLTLTDRLGNPVSYTQKIPTAEAFFHGRQGGRGAAFGKYAEEDDLLEVDWNLKTKKDFTAEGDAFIGGSLNVGDAETTRTNLGLGAVATEDVLPIEKGGTGASDAETARENLGIVFEHTHKELVWENASPNSTFAAQKVEKDLPEGSWVAIVTKASTSGSIDKVTFIEVGKSEQLFMFANAGASSSTMMYTRRADVSTTGVEFATAYSKTISGTTATATTAYVIPLRIYAIKGVQ